MAFYMQGKSFGAENIVYLTRNCQRHAAGLNQNIFHVFTIGFP